MNIPLTYLLQELLLYSYLPPNTGKISIKIHNQPRTHITEGVTVFSMKSFVTYCIIVSASLGCSCGVTTSIAVAYNLTSTGACWPPSNLAASHVELIRQVDGAENMYCHPCNSREQSKCGYTRHIPCLLCGQCYVANHRFKSTECFSVFSRHA